MEHCIPLQKLFMLNSTLSMYEQFLKPKCKFFNIDWSSTVSQKFFNAYKGNTDFGTCCLIVPYLNLKNPETRYVNSMDFDNSWYHEVPKGVRNGIQNGLTLVLDVETFNHGYFSTTAKGFRIAITNELDKPVINQAGLYIGPGIFNEIFPKNPIILKSFF